MLTELEDLLIMGDLGVSVSMKIVENLRAKRFGKDVTDTEVKTFLSEEIAKILTPVAQPLHIKPHTPHVILMVGVNGSGKTTTAAKLAKQWTAEGQKVSLAACDTFRAAAVEQLQVWGKRLNIPVISRKTGSDAAGLAYDAYAEAKARQDDILIIDTAGRLQNNTDLMNELGKIIRVLKKHDAALPHHTLLVLDATVGQNAHSQVSLFEKAAPLDGLILTKLDGTAKGGVLVSLADSFQKPIYALGVGEAVDDLKNFQATDFAQGLLGLENPI